jgi:hypothetical protein
MNQARITRMKRILIRVIRGLFFIVFPIPAMGACLQVEPDPNLQKKVCY